MGLSSSKAHHKVTKVAPMHTGEDLPALVTPCQLLGVPGQPSLRHELPPLRETWYGRSSAGPLSFNMVPGKEETSIIKQHPPRRPQVRGLNLLALCKQSLLQSPGVSEKWLQAPKKRLWRRGGKA
ncbi:hypothetical protein AV530_002959 [Patagioenas fasciata monilis]|uniref:Uncharacterized protein n=1 Tax=Patagioenas fasciata monilis TaxID=372326 RepID=A0A1V4L0V4_PATFA|nr:hypothetical protein AV530_002959 [Patagioenas fasciata monilis]